MRRRLTLHMLAGTLSALMGAVLGIGCYTFLYAEGGSYFSDDPKSCVNCHVMRDAYDGWQHSSHHAAATCNGCHTPDEFPAKYIAKAENGYFHSRAFTLQDFPEPIRISPRNARALQANCVRCHGDLVSTIAGHGIQEDMSCVSCHASVGHGPTR